MKNWTPQGGQSGGLEHATNGNDEALPCGDAVLTHAIIAMRVCEVYIKMARCKGETPLGRPRGPCKFL